MTKFLTIRPWQLFMLSWGLGIITIPIPLERIAGLLFAVIVSVFALVFFGWIYALGTELPKKLPETLRPSANSFKFHFRYIVSVFALIALSFVFREEINRSQVLGLVIVAAVLYYFVAIFHVVRFIAKSLASIELNRVADSNDYVGYMMLFWFSFIGIWIIQPKVNRIFGGQQIAG